MSMKHLKNNNSFRVFTALLLAISSSSLLAQNEGDAGGEGADAGGGSAAEAAVTSGGVSQPAEAAAGSTESNPVVTMVRAGVSWETAKTVKITDINKTLRRT